MVETFAIALLDACVLVPASLRDTLLRAARLKLYTMHWSADILAEVERTLVEDGMTSPDLARRLITVMQQSFPDASVHEYESIIPSMTNDDKDRHVLAAAVTAKADRIVTLNLSDFRREALEPWHVRAESPDAFLTALFYYAPGRLPQIIVAQAAALKNPPRTVDEVLTSLSVTVPTFADRVMREL